MTFIFFGGIVLLGVLCAVAATAIHVMIFVLESLRWMRPSTRRIFGLASKEEARITRPLALNQGFYNLFLAIGVAGSFAVISVPLLTRRPGPIPVDAAGGVLFFCLASMVAAAVVLVASRPSMVRAALIQGLAPLLAVVLLAPAWWAFLAS